MLLAAVWLVLLLPAAIGSNETCAQELLECQENVTAATESLANLTERYAACGCDVDPCAASGVLAYDMGLHVASVFIILVASALGVAVPLLAQHARSAWSSLQFAVVVGKCAGTGVILSVALVHMLLPSHEALTSPCAPVAFNSDYIAYAFLFALIAAVLMHFVDFLLAQFFVARQSVIAAAQCAAQTPAPATRAVAEESSDDRLESPLEQSAHHSHSHGSLLELQGQQWTGKRLAEAYMVEFAVSVHSVFIGLAVGVAADEDLVPLLIALVFHQFFEGVALGARIVDANVGRLSELILGGIFAVAAPVGIAIGIGVFSTINTNAQDYLLVQGIFDGLCAGILLYTGFTLLQTDFPRDMEAHCTGRYRRLKQAAMFAALWIAAGILAFLGRYL